MADQKHPRHYDEAFKRKIVQLYESGKPSRETGAEYDIARSTLRRWVQDIRNSGFTRAADDRTPEQNEPVGPGRRDPTVGDGGGRFRTGGAGTRTKVAVIRANASRYPISAQCGILGVPRSTY